MTVSDLLESKGLDYKLYFVEKNGVQIQDPNTVLKEGEQVKVYPKVRGG
jgi:sulfur carrier protein ThiS